MSPSPDEHALKKGTAELLVLAQLEDEPRHGYDIALRIEQRSNGAVVFNVASLYPVLIAWKRAGCIAGWWIEGGGRRRRRFYKLTAAGRGRCCSAARPGASSWRRCSEPRGSAMRDFVAHVRRHLPPARRPRRPLRRMVDELASELEARYVALTERGVSDEDAWTAVVAEVPSWPGLARTLATSSRGSTAGASLPQLWLAIDRTWRDLRHGVRVLRKQRGFTLTAIVTLAICLGGHAAILAGLNAMVLHPWRIPEPDRVLIVANQYPRVEARRSSVSAPPDYHDRLQGVPAFDEQALYNQFIATIETGDGATRMRGMVATPSLFRLLRVNPALGRIFTEEESTAGHDARILLTDGLWRDLFGADPTGDRAHASADRARLHDRRHPAAWLLVRRIRRALLGPARADRASSDPTRPATATDGSASAA